MISNTLSEMSIEEIAERVVIIEQAKSVNNLTAAAELDGLALIEPDDVKRRAMMIAAEIIRGQHRNICRAIAVITNYERQNAVIQ